MKKKVSLVWGKEMKIITTIAELRQAIREEKQNGKSVGYVPTMGFLHEGHVSLMQRARKENDISRFKYFCESSTIWTKRRF